MHSPSRTWQHEFEDKSGVQLVEVLLELGWVADSVKDYGEDYLVRIFCDGHFTGKCFWIQLKSTDDVSQYSLKSKELSYAIETRRLSQWHKSDIPVFFVLWDITHRIGYWLNLQTYIDTKLQADPDWTSDATKERKIRVPNTHALCNGQTDTFEKFVLGAFLRITEKRNGNAPSIERLNARNSFDDAQSSKPKISPQPEIAELEAMLDSDPLDTKSWLKLCYFYYENEEMEKALIAVNRAWELDSNDPAVITAKASVLTEYAIDNKAQKSIFQEAIRLFESLRNHEGTYLAALDYNLGNCYAGMGSYKEAINYYDAAIAAKPRSTELAAQIWKNRGTAFFYSNDPQMEVLSYKEALKLKPDLWECYVSWAESERVRENYKKSYDLLVKAFEIRPELKTRKPELVCSLIYLLYQFGEYELAYEYANKLLSTRPNSEVALQLKSHLLLRLFEKNSAYASVALSFFKSRLVDDPNDNVALSGLNKLFISKEHESDARKVLQNVVDLPEASPQAQYRYAKILENEGDFAQAIHYLELAFKQSPKHHIAHTLGRLKRNIGDCKNAVDYLKVALEGQSKPITLLHEIADCYYSLEDYENCLRFIVKCLLIDKLDSICWNNLVGVLEKYDSLWMLAGYESFLQGIADGQVIEEAEADIFLDLLLVHLTFSFGEDFVSEIQDNSIYKLEIC